MTARSFARSLTCLLATLALCGCLKGETVIVPPQPCCNTTLCSSGTVTQQTPAPDTGEGDDPCVSCVLTQLGTCVDGCGLAAQSAVDGCAVANWCATWSRVPAGSQCTLDRDCEPGQNDNTMTCQAGVCTEAGADKWANLTPVVCTDTTTYGMSPACANHGACLGEDDALTTTRYCSASKCVNNTDCPTGWHCRCQEQSLLDNARRAWRWCVPTLAPGPDAGS